MKFGQKVLESVGLDIGAYSIKIVSIKKENEGSILNAYNIKKIPPGTKNNGIDKLVKEAFGEIDLHPEDVNLAVSGPNVIVRFIDLPKMNKDQLENALSFEAEKYIPFNINEIVMDSLVLGDAEEAGKMGVLLAAAKRDLIQSRIDMMEGLGISVNAIDINSFAVFNAFLASNTIEDKGNAFFDFGHSQTNLLISNGNRPCFMRQIQIGGKDITEAIANDMGVPSEKAEEMKIKVDEVSRERVTQSTFSVLDELIREMQLSFGYFENRYNQAVSNIYCSGGVIYQEGIMDYLGMKLGLEAKKWNPVEKINMTESISKQDIEKVGSQLATCIGLALRG